jgi:hypothetical protein
MQIKVKFELYYIGKENQSQTICTTIESKMDPTHWDEMSSEDRDEYITNILWENSRTHILELD